jgi:hypothetical protein
MRGGCARFCAIKTSFAKELSLCQNPYHGFLALLGYHRDFDFAFLNIEDRPGYFTLGKNLLVFLYFLSTFPKPARPKNALELNEAFEV